MVSSLTVTVGGVTRGIGVRPPETVFTFNSVAEGTHFSGPPKRSVNLVIVVHGWRSTGEGKESKLC